MYAFGVAILVTALLMLIFMCLVYYITRKERMDIVKKAKAMKKSDLYQKYAVKTDNPFLKPIIDYVYIIDVKFDTSGEPWVCYYKKNKHSYSYYDTVSDFLNEYQPVNE